MDLVLLNERFAAIQQQNVVANERSSGFLEIIFANLAKIDLKQDQLSLDIQKLKQTIDSESVEPFVQTELDADIHEDSKNMILQIIKGESSVNLPLNRLSLDCNDFVLFNKDPNNSVVISSYLKRVSESTLDADILKKSSKELLQVLVPFIYSHNNRFHE